MLNIKLNKSLEKRSEYRGCCDIYGRRDGYGSEKWKKLVSFVSGVLHKSKKKRTFYTVVPQTLKRPDPKDTFKYRPAADGWRTYFNSDPCPFFEQTYEGAFFKDSFHGEGSYKTLTGSEITVYEGYFYSSFKEGYGVVSYPDGSVFEGLFNNNQAFGPGVYTYVNGRQDVGFWFGNKIVRLCRSVDFIIPRLAYTSVGKLKLLQFQTILPLAEENVDVGAALLFKHGVKLNKSFRLYSNFIHDPRSLFFNRIRFDKVYFVKVKVSDGSNSASAKDGVNELGESDDVNFLTRRNVCSSPEKLNAEAGHFVEEEEVDSCERIHVIAWNRSELCMDMLKQIFRFRSFEDKLSFKISDLMAGERLKFRKTGDFERICLHFLKMCSIGPSYVVKEMLCNGSISEELMDSRGNNSIMFAVSSDQHDVIDVLLNYGADVNSFNDENLTPLNFCLLRRISQTYALGNWEVCFLPPNKSPLPVNNEDNCDVRKSVGNLDRVFGDGMSVISEIAVEENTKKQLSEDDSVFCFQEEDDSRIGTSEITLLHYRTEELEKNVISGTAELKKGKEFQPLSYKREEFLQSVASPTDRDKYFFDLSSEICRNERKSDETEKECSASFNEKIINIDKTIELLLKRGADPNLADAPKPTIHLAVYCKEPKLVRLLLSYGASPDTQSLPQEGLLTPLHLVVLMKPSPEQVQICELLLNYGASPEEETSPTFTPGNDVGFLDFLDDSHGRTPLQLLCLRKEAEYIDDKGFLRQVAYLLARVSKKNKFFKGHSYLTLSMICGNYGIMETILKCRRTNPNEILGKNLGTCFHVLVSTELQKRTSLEDSIRMCDLLLENGGNPNITFEAPKSLIGNCVDYGYREIENEKQKRQSEDGDTKKREERYSLEDHLKVVEYIAQKSKRGPNMHGNNGTENKKKGKGGKSLDAVTKGPKYVKNNSVIAEKVKPTPNDDSSSFNMKKDAGTSKEKLSPKMRDNTKTVATSKDKENSKIVEIKKYAAANKEKFRSSATNKNKFVDDVRRKKITKKLPDTSAVTRNASKDARSGTVKRKGYSERLPERFRQSLLHKFGICDGFNLNDLLLPYVVLRNGDLYYRFKGQKPPCTEQYSLI